MRKSLIVLGIGILAVSWAYFLGYDFNGITGKAIAEEQIPSESGEMYIHFCPEEECEEILEDLAQNAESVRCAVHELSLDNFINALNNVDSEIIIDNNYECGGIENCVRDTRQALMHNKFCAYLIDGKKWVSTGSMNPTPNCANKNNNNLFVARSDNMHDNFLDEFNEMKNGKFGGGEKIKTKKFLHDGSLIEQGFCPEDDCQGALLGLVSDAKERIYFMTFSFTDDAVGDLVIEKSKEIDVIGLYEKTLAMSNSSEYKKMLDAGLKVHLDTNPKFMHHKVFIVDDAVYFGSVNPTQSGFKSNDENYLVIHNKDLAVRFVSEMRGLIPAGK